MIKNCKDCNSIFAHPTMNVCHSCYKKRNEDFAKVKEYLTKNRLATVAEVAEKTEVSIERIHEFLEEGRLKIRPSDVVLHCAICNEKIESGRVCNKCSAKMMEGQKPAVSEDEESVPGLEQRYSGKVHLYDDVRQRRKK